MPFIIVHTTDLKQVRINTKQIALYFEASQGGGCTLVMSSSKQLDVIETVDALDSITSPGHL